MYLYEEAATTPDRHNLENIRRGQYEALKTDIVDDPLRKPDFGPTRLTSAGATVIGARAPLIAYNVYLTTDDISIAQKIAKSMRNSSGGYRYVKALGLLVDGRAQISMNLTNFHQTPIFRVVESIRREAQRYGVAIHHSELVGLTPQEALINSAVWYLQLDGFKGEQILETRLYTSIQEQDETPSSEFIDDLASGSPTPGGGSASAYSGAMAAALVCMVAQVTIGKKKYADVESQMWNIIHEASELQQALKDLVIQDAKSFNELLNAIRLPKDTQHDVVARNHAIEEATITAARIPLAVCEKSLKVIQLAIEVASTGNMNALSDAGSAFSLARAAFSGASMNVQINLKGIEQIDKKQQLLAMLEGYVKELDLLEGQARRVLEDRGGIIP